MTLDDDVVFTKRILATMARAREAHAKKQLNDFYNEIKIRGVFVKENTASALYDCAVSIFQGSHKPSGDILEAALAEMQTFAPMQIQWLVPGTERTRLDGYIQAASVDWYFSAVVTPQERKNKQFNGEYLDVSKWSNENNRQCTFIGLISKCKPNALDKLRAKINPKIRIVNADNFDALRSLITEIRESL